MDRPRRSLRRLLLLSIPITTANAVALSDFSPRSSGLPSQCNAAYTSQIPGCSASDFAANSACSNGCLQGLVQINNLVNQNCKGVDVSEKSIIGLFLLGQGIQVLCNVAVVTQTSGQGSAGGASMASAPSASVVVKSTMVLSSAAAPTTSLTTDSSSPPPRPTSNTSPSSTTVSVSSSQSTASAPTTHTTTSKSSTPPKAKSSSSTSKTATTKTSSAAADAESVRSGNTQSGGGSPIDNIDNSAAAHLSKPTHPIAILSMALGLGMWLILR